MSLDSSLGPRLERRLMDILDQYRSMILDPVGHELDGSPNWKYLRGRLLKALGDQGLAGRIREALAAELKRNAPGDASESSLH